MSRITDVCILADVGESDDGFMDARDTAVMALGFNRVDQHGGGPKVVTGTVYLAAFNYLDEKDLEARLKKIKWRTYEHSGPPVALIKRENGSGWSVWNVEGL